MIKDFMVKYKKHKRALKNMDTSEEEKKENPIFKIIVAVVATIIILVLVGLYYYYAVLPAPVAKEVSMPITKTNSVEKSVIVPTKIIKFASPEILPTVQKSGSCFASSIAAPYRNDAWRCMIQNSISDPCFETKQKGLIYCQVNPLISDSILIKLTQVLPKASVLENIQGNWAWFLTLHDGTYCSPFTGTRPFFGKDQVAYYGCSSNNKNEQVVIFGDLTKNDVWTANKAILIKGDNGWAVKSSQVVDINTVWQ